jgi:hypothetical protein
MERIQLAKKIDSRIGYIKGQKTAEMRVKEYLEQEALKQGKKPRAEGEDYDEESPSPLGVSPSPGYTECESDY